MVWELRITKEPSWLSLSTCLENIIASIDHAHSQFLSMFEYRAIMRHFYSNALSKEHIQIFEKYKQMNVGIFIDPKTSSSSFYARITFAWIDLYTNHGNQIGWVIGSWCLINLLAIIGKFYYILFEIYMLSSCWVSIWTILALISFYGLVK